MASIGLSLFAPTLFNNFSAFMPNSFLFLRFRLWVRENFFYLYMSLIHMRFSCMCHFYCVNFLFPSNLISRHISHYYCVCLTVLSPQFFNCSNINFAIIKTIFKQINCEIMVIDVPWKTFYDLFLCVFIAFLPNRMFENACYHRVVISFA